MLSKTMDDRQYPLLAVQGSVKLANQVIIVMKHLTNPQKLFFFAEDALRGVPVFELNVEKRHGVDYHVSW